MQHFFRTKRDLYILPLCVFLNILLVMLLFSLCRLIFLAENLSFFPDLTPDGVSVIFRAGLIFDTSAVLYTNLLYIALALFPQPWKERRTYQKVLKWVFVLTNSIVLMANLVDVVYFPFSNKRTTASFFKEFAGEDNLNLSHIVWAEMCNHWYIVLALAVMIIILVCCYFKPESLIWRNTSSKGWRAVPVSGLRYHLTHFLVLAAVAFPIVAGLRGGTDRQTRPIAISNANQYVDSPKEAAIVLNTPFAIYRTIGSDILPEVTTFSDSERDLMESLFSPLHNPDPASHFKPLNVVIFIMESFGREYSGFLNQDIPGYEGYMPFLDSVMRSGLTYKYSFANGHQSIDAMPSVLSGIPRFQEPFFLTQYSLNDLSSVGRELASKGYYTAFFHGAKNGSMGFEAYARSAGYEDYYGRNEYREWLGHSDSDDYDGYWGIWDEPFLQFYADKMNTFKEPFCTGIFTASSHHPFIVPEKYEGVFPKGTLPIHQCIGYSDNALRKFFKKASGYDWFKRTLFVITGDHTNETCLPGYQTDAGVFGVPVVFYYPGGEDTPNALPNRFDEESIAQQCDIMPTVLGFLGYDSPFIAFGCNLLSTPPEQTFAVNHNNGIYQLFKGDYLLQFDGSRSIGLYRFRDDVLLGNNLVGTLPEIQQQMEDETRSIIQQYMERMKANQLVVRK